MLTVMGRDTSFTVPEEQHCVKGHAVLSIAWLSALDCAPAGERLKLNVTINSDRETS